MNNQYHVYYQTRENVGEIVIKQNIYEPITPGVLEAVRQRIREENNYSADEPVIICSWQRFE